MKNARHEVSQLQLITTPSTESTLLFISYFTGIRGNCPAEWADDKINVLKASGRKTVVLTGIGSHVTNQTGVHYVRVPSLSWNDYKEEIKELRAGGDSVSLVMYLFFPFALILGSIIDYFLRKVTKGLSAGRWSWFLTALPVAMWLKLRHGASDIFCTGGPTAAHVVGGVVVRLIGGRLFCEFQDPLLGATMTRSNMTRSISARIESWLVKISTKAVFVTQEAARLARERNPKHAHNINHIYPGAWQFVPAVSKNSNSATNGIEFLHLGTLYGSRNLDLFFKALDSLLDDGFDLARSVRVVNLGAVYCENSANYLERSDFQSLDALERIGALRRASQASCLMLIQHTDERSRETIPYKTYDYLNLGLPVLGLLNNDELSVLIKSQGGVVAEANHLPSIKEALKICLEDITKKNLGNEKIYEKIDIKRQFLSLISNDINSD